MSQSVQSTAQSSLSTNSRIGRTAVLLAVTAGTESEETLVSGALASGYQLARGQVGSMDLQKVVAAVETATKRNGLIGSRYREEHALYHAILDALQGVCRGPLVLGSILRTVGLSFAVVRGPRFADEDADGEWIAVCLYGQMGAPVKGWEHEVLGLGINHI